MDWNVFFSTISQTSGAIVGIFAAFLITKIISNQSDFSKLKNDATHNLIDSKTAKSEAEARFFQWFNERVREREISNIENDFLDKINEDIWNEEIIHTPNEYISKYNFSPFDDYHEIMGAVNKKITELSSKLEREREAAKAMMQSKTSYYAHLLNTQIYQAMPSHYEISQELTNEREQIDQLVIKVERQARKNEALAVELSCGVDSINLVTNSILAVLVLFFSGVIYPLSFLPWEAGSEISLSLSAFWDILFSLKGFMLVLISMIFSGLMIVFLFINNRLRHSAEVISELSLYSDISNYSPYLSNYIKAKSR
ncbi:hypothetical protein ACK36K_08405 [Aeromonas veronii]